MGRRPDSAASLVLPRLRSDSGRFRRRRVPSAPAARHPYDATASFGESAHQSVAGAAGQQEGPGIDGGATPGHSTTVAARRAATGGTTPYRLPLHSTFSTAARSRSSAPRSFSFASSSCSRSASTRCSWSSRRRVVRSNCSSSQAWTVSVGPVASQTQPHLRRARPWPTRGAVGCSSSPSSPTAGAAATPPPERRSGPNSSSGPAVDMTEPRVAGTKMRGGIARSPEPPERAGSAPATSGASTRSRPRRRYRRRHLNDSAETPHPVSGNATPNCT